MRWPQFRVTAPNVLVVYVCYEAELRPAIREHLFSFQRYASANVAMLNLAWGNVPDFIRTVSWDIIIFHTIFLCQHWGGRRFFENLLKRADALRSNPAVKVILPQDEFFFSQLFVDFINRFGISHVFSVAPQSCWKKIYQGVDFSNVEFHQVLTGYIDEKKINQLSHRYPEGNVRNIDIGYRCLGSPYHWFGRHGLLKSQIADVTKAYAPKFGLSFDISTSPQDVISGEAWYDFMARCRYCLGVESGTSLIDYYGTIAQHCRDYLDRNPMASFEEVETNCFPGLDGTCNLFAIGPRHMEACMTGTAQILIEGEYNGILHPYRHYLPLKKDFSNIEEVLRKVQNEPMRREIIQNVKNDILLTGKYTYRHFVEDILEITSKKIGSRMQRHHFAQPNEQTFENAAKREFRCKRLMYPILRYFFIGKSILKKWGNPLRQHVQKLIPQLTRSLLIPANRKPNC